MHLSVPLRSLPRTGDTLYAHTPPQDEPGKWHLLRDHLRSVGDLAAEFAEPFGGSSIARLLGYTHDAGKACIDTQQALRLRAIDGGRRLGVPHKLEGSALAGLLLEAGNELAAYVVCLANFGHHNGIPDWTGDDSHRDVLKFMKKHPGHLDALVALLDETLDLSLRDLAAEVQLPSWIPTNPREGVRQIELFTRMCHSALVDADFLDTDAHFKARDGIWRSPRHGVSRLRTCFMDAYDNAFASTEDSELNVLRRRYFDASVRVALVDDGVGQRPGGIYRLPAPTGTGKTMSAAAFALHHAEAFDKQRVIVAVPFTSITTQNAQAYREMFSALGDDVVLEHHSNILDDVVAEDSWRRLGAANWDAEFIVTTTVQLFDSLFSNKPAATRKLHRVADSVVIIDEVQAIPLRLLASILRMLRELTEHFGVTVLLASATQPAFWSLDVWSEVEPIDVLPIDEVPEITRRVQYDVRTEEQPWDAIALEVVGQRQALAIVNTTQEAQNLYRMLAAHVDAEATVLHLSARMCQSHRGAVLDTVRARLTAKSPVMLISTQLIEAGVDVDFPVVFRALAPAESVVQSAGRCNREGCLGVAGGRVIVFQPEQGKSPPGDYRTALGLTRSQFVEQAARAAAHGQGFAEFGEPQAMQEYFEDLYGLVLSSERKLSVVIDKLRDELGFRSTEEAFKMIDDTSVPVVVTDYGPPAEQTAVQDVLAHYGREQKFLPTRAQRRLLQAHTATMPKSLLVQPGLVDQLPNGPYRWIGEYDPACGLLGVAGNATIW